MFITTLALGSLATIGSAHMLMKSPEPYGKSSLDNGPLQADGSNFPCKQRQGVYDGQDSSNVFPLGSSHKLSFKGSAVHGGGSCQVSVTVDLKPTKNSVWKVIKSIEGGCPAKNQGGNMGGGADADDPYLYDYTIPNEMMPGNYTLAWTWFNRIGNREMYMNCAPLTVTGSGGSQGFLDSLPDMFVANIGNGCSTTEGTDVKFPNPGKDVDRFGKPEALAPPVAARGGSCPAAEGGQQPASTGQPAYTTQANNNGNSPTDSPPHPTDSSPGSGNSDNKQRPGPSGGVFKTVSPVGARPTRAASSAKTSTAVQPQSTSLVSNPAAPSSPQPGSGKGGSPSDAYAAGTPCASEGSWNCIGGSSFQRCASGMWSETEELAEGTTCTPGQSAVIKMGVGNPIKQALRYARAFVA